MKPAHHDHVRQNLRHLPGNLRSVAHPSLVRADAALQLHYELHVALHNRRVIVAPATPEGRLGRNNPIVDAGTTDVPVQE